MPKATVTYSAPKGDSKVVEMMGHTFYDGQSQEVDLPQDRLDKLASNPCFQPAKGGRAGEEGGEENKEARHTKR